VTDERLAKLEAIAATLPGAVTGDSPLVQCAYAVPALVAEIRRLKRGEFTPDEFQALCHHRDERPGCTRASFEAGCREYQRKLFGPMYQCPSCENVWRGDDLNADSRCPVCNWQLDRRQDEVR